MSPGGIAQPPHGASKTNPRPDRRPLDTAFRPESVAIIGATEREGSVGRAVLENVLAPSPGGNVSGGKMFGGSVYPVNPKRSTVLGLASYPSILDVPQQVDLAVIITPAATVPAVIGECIDAGVGTAIVISAGFRELGPEGQALEDQIANQLGRAQMRLIGPNCLGAMNPTIGFNATFAQTIARPGNVAFLSQSGALLTAILDWSLEEQVGFSAIVSTGSMLDVGWGDLIDYFGDDPATQSILLYMESVGAARSFLSAAREVALRKPIIVIKAGRTAAASKAASSHTGALTGSDEVFDAALQRCGVLRVERISDLFHMAEVLGKQPRPKGPRLTILTNAGGPGVLATDTLLATGGELAPLSDTSLHAFNQLLPKHWSHANPIDILGDADPERYSKALEIASADTHTDGLLVILAPQGMTDPLHVAERLKAHAKIPGKPVLASWMGGKIVLQAVEALNASGIPTFSYPDTAVRAFTYMWRFSHNLRALYETPSLTGDLESLDDAQSRVRNLLEGVRAAGRTVLTELESKQVMAHYGIPVVDTRIAHSESEAIEYAASIGFPVVLKLYSQTITHKSDVGGVKLNLQNAEAVRQAFAAIDSSVLQKAGPGHFGGVTVQPMVSAEGYELIVGSSVDDQFGPVILFGSGGQFVEVYQDHALALPPLNTTLATRMMEQTRIFHALHGVRGRPAVAMSALENALVRFSRLVVDQPRIREMDINPLVASAEGVIALDARIVLQDAKIPDENLPRPAIRPYPTQYVSQWKMKNGIQVLLRPIRPEDEPAMAKFHETLSDRSVYLRFFHMGKLSTRVSHERLLRRCFIDYDREMAIVADHTNRATGDHEILAVGRLTRQPGGREAEVAVLVSDHYHNQGLGGELLGRLIQFGRDEKLERIVATILLENVAMRALVSRQGFIIQPSTDMDVLQSVLTL